MTKEKIKAIILLLETTLGSMPPASADNVVRGVIAILNSEISN